MGLTNTALPHDIARTFRVLVDKSIRNGTCDLLKAAGFSTATFEDAESLLGSVSRVSAACVVADMRMPGMTGLELYQ